MTAARPATVGWSNRAASGISVPSTSRTWEITRVASSECPPRAKKSSPAPTRSMPRTCAQIPASSSSRSPRGATYPPTSGRVASGAGSAARSSFPFGVSGSAASSVNTAGIMNSGSRPARNARSSPAAGTPACASAGTSQAASRAPIVLPADGHHRVADAGVILQRGLHLTRLDPVPRAP